MCADCQVDLVATLPPLPHDERPDMELVTVFDSTNPALIGIAKTVLDAAGIEFLVVGDDGARIFSGNPFLGRVRLQVEKNSAKKPKRCCPRFLKARSLSKTNHPSYLDVVTETLAAWTRLVLPSPSPCRRQYLLSFS